MKKKNFPEGSETALLINQRIMVRALVAWLKKCKQKWNLVIVSQQYIPKKSIHTVKVL
jgi:hypothetical protein